MDALKEAEKHIEEGIEFKKAGEYQAAILEFEAAVNLEPKCAIAQMELGWLIYGYQNDLNKAQQHLIKALEVDDSLANAHMYLGIVLNRLGIKGDAEYHFKKSIMLSKDAANSAIAHATYAEEFLWHNSIYGDAEKHFKSALAKDPDCTLAIRDYARMLACHGRNEEAKALFNKALTLDPDDEYTKNGLKLILEEQNREPIECLRKAVKKDPNYSEGIRILGELMQNKD
jgi:tetratricopeptide (TPR) repeat protein